MRKAITINIPEPCHEDWKKMTPKEQGRHCAACNKTVIDFTKKTDEQIIKTFETEEKLCGRFKNQQLNRKIVLSRKDKNCYLSWVASGLFAFMALGNQDIHAQGKPKTMQIDSIKTPQVKGKIATSVLNKKIINGNVSTATDGLPLPGATLTIKGKKVSTQTDFYGNFKIKARLGDTLVANFIGMDKIETVVDNKNEINFAITESTLGELVIVDYLTNRSKIANQRRIKRIEKRIIKQEAIRNGEQKRTILGKFFFGIKSLFLKK